MNPHKRIAFVFYFIVGVLLSFHQSNSITSKLYPWGYPLGGILTPPFGVMGLSSEKYKKTSLILSHSPLFYILYQNHFTLPHLNIFTTLSSFAILNMWENHTLHIIIFITLIKELSLTSSFFIFMLLWLW